MNQEKSDELSQGLLKDPVECSEMCSKQMCHLKYLG